MVADGKVDDPNRPRAMPDSGASPKAPFETSPYEEAPYEEEEAEDGQSTAPHALPSEAHHEPQVRAPGAGQHADKVWGK